MKGTRWLGIGVAVTGGVAAAAAATVAIAGARWNRATARAVARLDAAAAREETDLFDPAMLAGLPDPVVRYFRFAIPEGHPLARRARVEQTGEFLLAPGRWSRFVAVSEVAVDPPGFVWDARIRMAPLLDVRVRDSYFAGDGRMLGRVLGLATVVDQHGTREMAEASLQRWLAEAPWLPSALLPRTGVSWTPIDDSTARATVTDGEVQAAVDFHFAPGGGIAGTSAMRYRDVNGTPVPQRWVGHFRDYERVGGIMLPREGEVAWEPEGRAREAYWRGRIGALRSH